MKKRSAPALTVRTVGEPVITPAVIKALAHMYIDWQKQQAPRSLDADQSTGSKPMAGKSENQRDDVDAPGEDRAGAGREARKQAGSL
jgi:hypothetical protein